MRTKDQPAKTGSMSSSLIEIGASLCVVGVVTNECLDSRVCFKSWTGWKPSAQHAQRVDLPRRHHLHGITPGYSPERETDAERMR
jgi:hypothetical protein